MLTITRTTRNENASTANFYNVLEAKKALRCIQSAYGWLTWNADEHAYISADKSTIVDVYGDADMVKALHRSF